MKANPEPWLSVLGRAFTCAGSRFSHVEFYVVTYLFFLLKKATPSVSIALLQSLLSHHVAFPLGHTPCIIADIKITCQNTSTLAPLHP